MIHVFSADMWGTEFGCGRRLWTKKKKKKSPNILANLANVNQLIKPK